jgi:hypothetical protein
VPHGSLSDDLSVRCVAPLFPIANHNLSITYSSRNHKKNGGAW